MLFADTDKHPLLCISIRFPDMAEWNLIGIDDFLELIRWCGLWLSSRAILFSLFRRNLFYDLKTFFSPFFSPLLSDWRCFSPRDLFWVILRNILNGIRERNTLVASGRLQLFLAKLANFLSYLVCF